MGVVAVTIAIKGGASFPGRVGTLTVTWPLAIARADAVGISVDIRSRVLKRALGWFVDDAQRSATSPWWSARWEDLVAAEFGRRSLTFQVRERRGCRFVTIRRSQIRPLVAELEGHGVTVSRVPTTLGWFVRASKERTTGD